MALRFGRHTWYTCVIQECVTLYIFPPSPVEWGPLFWVRFVNWVNQGMLFFLQKAGAPNVGHKRWEMPKCRRQHKGYPQVKQNKLHFCRNGSVLGVLRHTSLKQSSTVRTLNKVFRFIRYLSCYLSLIISWVFLVFCLFKLFSVCFIFSLWVLSNECEPICWRQIRLTSLCPAFVDKRWVWVRGRVWWTLRKSKMGIPKVSRQSRLLLKVTILSSYFNFLSPLPDNT